MAFSSTAPLPRIDAAAARRLILAALPRRLRFCLDGDLRISAAREALSSEITSLVPEAAALAATWCASAIAAGADPWCDPDLIAARNALVSLLDWHAAAADLSAARALADLVTLTSCGGADAAAAARLALPLWLEAETLPELSLQLSAMAEAQTRIGLGRAARGDAEAERDIHEQDAEAVLFEAWTGALEGALLALRAAAASVVAAAAILSRGATSEALTCSLLVRALTFFGERLTQPVADQAGERERRRRREAEAALAKSVAEHRETSRALSASREVVPTLSETAPIPAGQVLVVAGVQETGTDRGRSLTKGYEAIIGRLVPLASVPDLRALRSVLQFEFPYAVETIDRLLTDLVGRSHLLFRPTLLVGPPGAGKSRLVARVAHHLGVGLWRVDATHDSGAAIGGLDRRWATAEPAHPAMAIARFGIANPLILVDELEKASTRRDYGRLWDSLLPLLEPETAAAYPDPAFQTAVNLSHVSWLATANSTSLLPGPLLDRFRVIEMPGPTAADLEALLPSILAGIAARRGIDPRFLPALDSAEIAITRRAWPGGSIRHLTRLVETVVAALETVGPRH
jgi:ATP-dependent Lon protease